MNKRIIGAVAGLVGLVTLFAGSGRKEVSIDGTSTKVGIESTYSVHSSPVDERDTSTVSVVKEYYLKGSDDKLFRETVFQESAGLDSVGYVRFYAASQFPVGKRTPEKNEAYVTPVIVSEHIAFIGCGTSKCRRVELSKDGEMKRFYLYDKK